MDSSSAAFRSHLASAFKLGEDPIRLHPRTWESIPSHSGTPSAPEPRRAEPVCEPCVVSEELLVRLMINALHGNKTSLAAIEKLSEAFSSSPADRTLHQVPNLWQRSSSTKALGRFLRSFSHAGYVFLYLWKFVDYFLILPSKSSEGSMRCSLVNQAYAVAVKTILEGYVCAINTLSVSVKLRRSTSNVDDLANDSCGLGSLTSIVLSDITVLEVYLQTRELRVRMEALGNLCQIDLETCGKDLNADKLLGFDDFPTGAKLLTYLYVQLLDPDLVHRELLRFLFVRSWEPYYGFIKSWIFKAEVDDPFSEFIVKIPDLLLSTKETIGCISNFPLPSIEERNGIHVPSFLEDVYHPLFRAGQQLQVLLKLLDLCNFSIAGKPNSGEAPAQKLNLEDVLPYWKVCSNDLPPFLSPLTFQKADIERVMVEKEIMFKNLWEKMKVFLAEINTRSQQVRDSHPFQMDSRSLSWPVGRCSRETSAAYTMIEGLDFSGYNIDEEDIEMDAGSQVSDVSSTSNASYDEPFSESSQLESSEEETEVAKMSPDLDYAFSSLSKPLTCKSGSQRMLETEKSSSSHESYQEVDTNITKGKVVFEDTNLASVCMKRGYKSYCRAPGSLGDDYGSVRCWPLGGLVKNPFNAESQYNDQIQSQFGDYNSLISHELKETIARGESCSNVVFVSKNDLGSEPSTSENANSETSSDIGVRGSWFYQLPYDLNRNPVLSKFDLHSSMGNTTDKMFLPKERSLPYFDFTSVGDSHKSFMDSLSSFSHPNNGVSSNLSEDPTIFTMGFSGCIGSGDPVDPDHVSEPCSPACSSSNFNENKLETDFPGTFVGGANWEILLRFCDAPAKTAEIDGFYLSGLSEMPLDVIIDRCILRDILLQYKYISCFTIKLLEEGFSLHEHLLALRRYHFIELADWADLFITSLYHRKWCVTNPNQKIAEIQILLDLALQRSSCDGDPYRERLFVYTKEQNAIPLSTSPVGLFDSVFLSYRIDWPLNLVVSPEALNIYADICSFLMQVRLALFTLADVWCSVKDFLHFKGNDNSFGSMSVKGHNTFLKVRLQVHHFVSTLQQFVQSQLYSVAWCKFGHSLKHQVKDMLDLELVHMSYLTDALHICFLSPDTQPISHIIKNILRCALDFRSCINGTSEEVESNEKDPTSVLSRINFPQVLAVKDTFDRNVKDLYICYLKSSKNRESLVYSFWNYLNFNEYNLNLVKEMLICT